MSREYGIQPWDMWRLRIDEYAAIARDLEKMAEALKN